MPFIDSDTLFKNSKISLINTRQKRYNNVRYKAEVKCDRYILTSEQGKLEMDIFDEVVLSIIGKYKFCPLWLAKQWYETNTTTAIGVDNESKIRKFIDFGLLYAFPSTVATFLMPTERLASILDIKLGEFTNPPYNTLTHTISEEQVMFECLTGKAKYLEGINCIPYISIWGIGAIGCCCIPEIDYSIRNSYFNNHIEEFNDQEANLAKEMLSGNIVTTADFKELKMTIHKKQSQHKYGLKIPDLAVLATRKLVGNIAMPQSIALEVELTNKGIEKYIDIFEIYWNNLKYGRVVYLVNDKKTRDCLVKAYKTVWNRHINDDKTCEFKLVEFVVPYDRTQLDSI